MAVAHSVNVQSQDRPLRQAPRSRPGKGVAAGLMSLCALHCERSKTNRQITAWSMVAGPPTQKSQNQQHSSSSRTCLVHESRLKPSEARWHSMPVICRSAWMHCLHARKMRTSQAAVLLITMSVRATRLQVNGIPCQMTARH